MGKLKGKAAKKGALGRSEQQMKEEAQFYKCPKGHTLPHKTNKGHCTPIWCAGSMPSKPKKETAIVKAPPKGLSVPSREGEADPELEVRLDKAKGRRNARLQAVEFPEKPMEGAEAEEFADRELVKMLPEAVAELKYKLRFGDDDQREKAADRIMNATGRGKREQSVGGASPIIMLVGSQPGKPVEIPWFQRVEPSKLPEGGK